MAASCVFQWVGFVEGSPRCRSPGGHGASGLRVDEGIGPCGWVGSPSALVRPPGCQSGIHFAEIQRVAVRVIHGQGDIQRSPLQKVLSIPGVTVAVNQAVEAIGDPRQQGIPAVI